MLLLGVKSFLFEAVRSIGVPLVDEVFKAILMVIYSTQVIMSVNISVIMSVIMIRSTRTHSKSW